MRFQITFESGGGWGGGGGGGRLGLDRRKGGGRGGVPGELSVEIDTAAYLPSPVLAFTHLPPHHPASPRVAEPSSSEAAAVSCPVISHKEIANEIAGGSRQLSALCLP